MFDKSGEKIDRFVREVRVRKCKTPFVIWFRERSGSSHLRTTLDNHPEIACQAESFFQIKLQEGQSIPEGVVPFEFRKSKFIRRIAQFSKSKRFSDTPNRAQIVQHLHDIFSIKPKACGFKFKYPLQVRMYPEVMKELRELSSTLYVIVLHRKNVLKQAISRLSMQRIKSETDDCNIAIRIPNGIRLNRPVQLDGPVQVNVPKLLSQCCHLLDEETSFFKDVDELKNDNNELQILQIDYEDMLQDNDATVRKVFRFLNVDPDARIISNYKKATPIILPKPSKTTTSWFRRWLAPNSNGWFDSAGCGSFLHIKRRTAPFAC